MVLTAAADVQEGAMIALVPRDAEALAVGNEPAENLHVTLSYLGKAADLDEKRQGHILEVAEALSQHVPLKARVSGIAYLNDECTVILVDSAELRALHDLIIAEIGTKSSYPGYLPHITVDYGDSVLEVGDLPEEIEFSALRVAFAGENTDFDGLALTADLLGKAKEVAGKVGKVFDEALHPRAKNGQWIEKDGFVKGVMTFRGKDGKPEVRRGVTAKVVDIRQGVVHVVDKDGNRGVASARTLDEAAPPKARINPDTPWVHHAGNEGFDPKAKPVQQSPEARKQWLVKAMSDQAVKLTDDPEQRIPILEKMMGGLRGSPLTTVYEHNKQGPSGDEWSDERMAKHEALWDSLLERIEVAGVPRERRSLVLGGPPGAGKSFSLKPGEAAAGLGVNGWDLIGDPPEGVTHVVMNPDVIKELMIESDMLPPLPKGLRPREAASMTHAESNFLTMLFMSRLAALDINTVYDSTMANRSHVEKNIRALAEAGYTFQGLYVKIPKQESATSARNRYIEESLTDPELGGRFVPSEASSAWDTEGTFKQFQSWFTDGWLMVDNTGLTKGEPRKEIYAEGVGSGAGIAHFLTPMPPPEHRPKRAKPPVAAGDPKQRSFWEPSGIPSVIEPYKKADTKPVVWKPGMKLDDEGNVVASAFEGGFVYTDTQAALGMHAGVLSPDEFLELLRQNLVLVTPPVDDDEEDYLWATTVFHEINRAGRGALSYDVGAEYNRLREAGFVRDLDEGLTASAPAGSPHPPRRSRTMKTMNPRTPRQFHIPGGEGTMTLDDMELFENADSPLGDWARRVLAVEREKTLDEIGCDRFLPRGVIDPEVEGGILVASLVNRSGQIWTGSSWDWPETAIDMDATVDMDEAAVAFVARAQMEGADAVIFRDPLPLGVIGAGSVKQEGSLEPPDNSVMVAIVDAFDKNAVLELVAVAPGPRIHRRHDGQWFEDTAWVDVFKSVKPPPMVKLEDTMLASVASQVDSATAGQPFQPFKTQDRTKYMVASSFLEELDAEADAAMVASNLAMVAVAGRELSPKDVKNTEQLRRYWLYGKGAAKIRWGTPGAWRRCYRNVVKYMGPGMAKGYCTNLSQRLGGQGVATHVGD